MSGQKDLEIHAKMSELKSIHFDTHGRPPPCVVALVSNSATSSTDRSASCVTPQTSSGTVPGAPTLDTHRAAAGRTGQDAMARRRVYSPMAMARMTRVPLMINCQLVSVPNPGFPNWLSQVGDDGNRMRFPRRLRQ